MQFIQRKKEDTNDLCAFSSGISIEMFYYYSTAQNEMSYCWFVILNEVQIHKHTNTQLFERRLSVCIRKQRLMRFRKMSDCNGNMVYIIFNIILFSCIREMALGKCAACLFTLESGHTTFLIYVLKMCEIRVKQRRK